MWSTWPAVLPSNLNPDLQAAPGVWGKLQTGDKGMGCPLGQNKATGAGECRRKDSDKRFKDVTFAQAPPAALAS